MHSSDDAFVRERPENLHDPSLYVNRELSLLEFQRRVLEEAVDERNPLLERVKFLSIVFSNLNEFFMVRVAGLKKQQIAGVSDVPPDGLTPAEQLAAIRKAGGELMRQAQDCYSDSLLPELDREGIHLLNYDQLSKSQRNSAAKYFREVVYPVITPLAYDPGRPFPHISNLSLNLAVILRDADNLHHFARIKVPKILGRFVPLKQSSGGHRKDGTTPRNHYFVWLDQLITAHLDELFPGMEIVEVHPFHVTRDADIAIQELEAADLLETVEESIRKRRFGSVVRLIVNEDISESVRDILVENMEIDPRDVYTLRGPLALTHLWDLYDIDRPELKYTPFVPAIPAAITTDKPSAIADKMQSTDVLVHHPYDSFTPVSDFLEWAATDPNVLAIKQTLYRVGPNSPIVSSLLKAVQNGKQVAVLVELKARFDEESNIEWVRRLEQEGVHVVYGLLGLKNALQGPARGSPRGRSHPPLHAPGDRKLQPRDRAPVRRHRYVHDRRADRRGLYRPFQLPDGLLQEDRLRQAVDRAAAHETSLRVARAAGDAARRGGPARSRHFQDQLGGRQPRHSFAVRGVAGGRTG